MWISLAFSGLLLSADPAPDPFVERIQPLLKTYCHSCHGELRGKGGVRLATFKDEAAVLKNPRLWETVKTQIRDRAMPPQGKPQPSQAERDLLLQGIDQTLDKIELSTHNRDPGRVLIHRLSRLEYNNTVRDLLGVDTKPADSFPADGGGGAGFDHIADTLYIPPILLEKYLEAATEIADATQLQDVLVAWPTGSTSESEAAKRNIEHLAARAFRRPVEPEELDRLLRHFERARQRGLAFDPAMKQVIRAALMSPNFLFRSERDQSSTEPYRVNDWELASRLSYFLWSSMPDAELFQLARSGRLGEATVLDAQVRRMLADPKAATLSENFVGQWLGIRNLKDAVRPDPRKYPDFTTSLCDALVAEPILFFQDLLKNDGSLVRLLDADYTFANEEMAKLYGLSGVRGSEMRKVVLTDRNRGGILAMGSVLTLTSYPQRTSPVLRGKWVLEEILGTPPPPPPPNVRVLPPDDAPKDKQTFRQRLEAHRNKPECASCHKRLDPLGFGLENFDGIGRWRTEIGGEKVDATGELATGEKFSGPAELKQLLLKQKDQFVRNLTEKLLCYALGRGLEFYDTPTVKRIAAEVLKRDCRSTVLVQEIVRSYPFQYRRNAPPQAATK